MPLHKKEFFAQSLKRWFEEKKRPLPWRQCPSPYRVWISEVMLQQTQASVVIGYFERWMERFPDLETLASATEEEVLKLWEGLGYYSRARNLHQGARTLVKDFEGRFPNTPEELSKVKGIGPYTLGAIMSFAFHKKMAAVDGNVLRVISRFLCIEEEIDRTQTRMRIEKEVENLLPDDQPWIVMEALIELGAQICKKKANCSLCPIRDECLSHIRGKVDDLPKKSKKQSITILHRDVFVVECQGALLLQQHTHKRLMGGLCEFPYFERGTHTPFHSMIQSIYSLKRVTHTFTRYKAHLYPTLFTAKYRFDQEGYMWVELKKLDRLAFSSGHSKILRAFMEGYANLTH